MNEHLPTHKSLASKYASSMYAFIPNLSNQQEIFEKCKLTEMKRTIAPQGWYDFPLTLVLKLHIKQTK
jgi:hypothetical protein